MGTVEEFDPDLEQWNMRSPMPVGLRYLTAETWRDTLIFLLGGEQSEFLQNATPYIYDPFVDQWTDGTQFHTERRSHGSAIFGDTLFIWAGYKHMAVFPEDMEMGVINPLIPSSITWSVVPGVPAGGFINPAGDEMSYGDHFAIVSCGGLFENTRYYDGRTYFKQVHEDLWHRTLDRPEPGSASDNGVGGPNVFYTPGGYNGENATSRFFALEFPDDSVHEHDVGIHSMKPSTSLPEDTVICPEVVVKNYGSHAESFEVFCEISPGGYFSSSMVEDLDPGDTVSIQFPDSALFESGFYWVKAYTELPGDEKFINNAWENRIEASEWYHDWLFRDDGAPIILGTWVEAENGWGTRFHTSQDMWIDSLACCFDPDFVGGTDSTAEFRVYGADSSGTIDTTDLRIDTIVSGIHYGWNKVEIDTSHTEFDEGEYFFVFYVQQAPYPDAPGMFGDIKLDHPHDQWILLDGSFSYPTGFPGDHSIRARSVAANGVAEWLGVAPIERDFEVSYLRSASGIEFLFRGEESLGPLTVRVYDALGRCVRVLSEDLILRAEERRMTWNERDDLERKTPIGIYFLNVRGPKLRHTIKVFKGD
jgi:hypothetical protein